MQPFVTHTGVVAPMDRVNVDTDQIIPKQFLKRIERTGFGQFLFFDWRFNDDGTPNPDFVLNQPGYEGASVLVAGRNFGSGSSREHAPWALLDYGGNGELYDMVNDPKQYNNLFGEPDYAQILANLKVKLKAKLNEVEQNDLPKKY